MTQTAHLMAPGQVKAAGKLVAEGVVLSPALLLHLIAAGLIAIDLVAQGAGATLWLVPLAVLAAVAIPFILWAALITAAQLMARVIGITYQPVLLGLSIGAAVALGPTIIAALIDTVGPLVTLVYLGSYGITMIGLFAWRDRLGLAPLFDGEPTGVAV
jgi:hypothetical protein